MTSQLVKRITTDSLKNTNATDETLCDVIYSDVAENTRFLGSIPPTFTFSCQQGHQPSEQTWWSCLPQLSSQQT